MNLILGTANFGNDYGKRLEKPECFKILDRAKELGVWAIDTAAAYGNAEEIIDEWVKLNNDEMVIFNKTNYTYYSNHNLLKDAIMLWHGDLKKPLSVYGSILGASVYNTAFATDTLDWAWLQAPFNPMNLTFLEWVKHPRFIARSIFCGGRLQRSHPEDVARLCFGFLKSHNVKNCVFGVESIEELELNVRIANEK